MNTFSLATLLTCVVIVGGLLPISRLGYWPCVAAWTILGALVLTTVASLITASPRLLFVILGAIGGLCGCLLGSRIYSASFEEPTQIVTLIEYERIYLRHRLLFIATILGSTVAGSTIGFVMCNVVARKLARTLT